MTGELRIIRCSSLDDLFACTPSVLDDQGLVRINPSGEAAELGKVCHNLASTYIETGKFDIKATCARFGQENTEEVAYLMQFAVKAWEELKRFFPQPATERVAKSDILSAASGEYRLHGTIDVVSPFGKSAIFLDWKSGFISDGYHQNMHGYAYCLWCELGKPEDIEIAGVVCFLRHRYHRVVKYTPKMLKDWEYDLLHNVLGRTDVFRPGQQCVYCPLYAGCAARQQLVGGTLAALMLPADTDDADPHKQFLSKASQLLSAITPENKDAPEVREAMTEMRYRLALAKQVIEDAHTMIRGAVERVGAIDLADGQQLAIREVKTSVVDPAKAMKVLRTHLADADIAEAMKLSLPKLRAMKASRYVRGEKRAAIEQLEKDLEAAGALSVSVQKRLEETEKEPESEQPQHALRIGGPTARTGAGASPGDGEREVA